MNPVDPKFLSPEQREQESEQMNQLHMKQDQIVNLVRDLEVAKDKQLFAEKRVEYLACTMQRAIGVLIENREMIARTILSLALGRAFEFSSAELTVVNLDGEIPCAGRGLRKPVVQLQPGHRGLVIRVDDDDNPEFWLELCISETRLLRALAAVHRARHGAPDPPGQ